MFATRNRITTALLLTAVLAPAAGQAAGGAAPPLYQGSAAVSELVLAPTDGGAVRPTLPGAGELAETGKPVLPVRTVNLLVPTQSPISGIEIVPLQTHRVPLTAPLALGAPLVTDKGQEVPVDRLPLEEQGFPAVWGEYGGSHTWRGFRFVSAAIYPVRALRDESGAWTGLEVLDRYEIRPVYEAGGRLPDLARRERLVPGERAWCESVLRDLCANPEALAGYDRFDGVAVSEPAGGFQPTRTPSISGSAVSYLIITDETLAPAFQVLAEHKTALGLPAVVVTREWIQANYRNGVDIQETIRSFIREAYSRWGVQYVLIGGDTDVIPARYATNTYFPIGGYTEIPTDLYYAGLDGNWNEDGDWVFGEHYSSYLSPGDDADLAEDVFVGRATVSTPAQAADFIDKVIGYEGLAAGTAWTSRALLAAEVLFWQGDAIQLDGATFAQGLLEDYILPCTDLETARMYESWDLTDDQGQLVYPGSVPLTRAALIDSLNSGHYGIFNQFGHGFYFNMSVGDANFTIADADGLTNTGRPFLLYALNCASAAFDYSCLLERFLQHPDGGSIISIGASRAAFPHTANNYQREFFNQLYCQGESHVGDLVALSKLPYLSLTFTNTVDRWTVLNYTLLGDPSLPIWTDSPQTPDVAAPAVLAAGEQTVTVGVSAGGSPVAGALVCLAKDGDDYSRGETDGMGQVQLPFTAVSGGPAVLTVSGRNLARTEVPVTIDLAGAPYVAAASVEVQDDGAAGSVGNGNGTAESGETVALWFSFHNSGAAATGCNAQLSSAETGVTIVDGTAVVGSVPAGGTVVAADPFLVHLDPGVADGEFLDFAVTVNDGLAASYESEWTLTAEAPELEAVELVWSDWPGGNGDGILDPGEQVTVELTLKNYGAGRADQVTGRLRTLDPDIAIQDSVVEYGGLETLESSGGSALFSLSEGDLGTESWCWVLFEDNYGRTFRHDFKLRPPVEPDGLESDSSLGPDTIALNWLPMRSDGVRGYNVYRSEAPAGPFTRANVDLLDGISYYRDEGLDLLRRYYYRVTAVDSSLVEGPPSLVISQSTAPPEIAGFPLPFDLETSGHLAVGDVNGDGLLEIVLGADEVYVWNSRGEELFDGDDDAQTHGPITALETQFGPAGIALAQLDGQPGLEMVVSETMTEPTDQNAIHVFRHDGSELPGWPHPVRQTNSGWNWATPAVGDVDGDGDPEIVVNTQDSRTWVWHVDGSELRDGDGDPATDGVFVDRGNNYEYGKSSPALYDLDGDGACEIIFGTNDVNGNNSLVAYRYDGSQAPGFPYVLGDERCITSPAVADLNGDGVQEIIFNTRWGKLYVIEEDGGDYQGFPKAWGGATNFNPSPAVGDLDGDGQLEIVAVRVIGGLSAEVYGIDTDIAGGTSGQVLAGWPQTVPGNSEGSPVVGDVDGDGLPDVLFGIGGGSTDSPNNLYAFSSDGGLVDGFPITLGGPLRPSPVLSDFDRDGDIDIIYGGWDTQIHVWDMPSAFDPYAMPWPTFHGHSSRDGVYRGTDLVGVPDGAAPARLALLSPFPNPFNPSTHVRLFLPGPAGARRSLTVGVYDLRGRLVRSLHRGEATTGWHDWTWDGRDDQGRGQASGLYLLRATSGSGSAVRKMSLVK